MTPPVPRDGPAGTASTLTRIEWVRRPPQGVDRAVAKDGREIPDALVKALQPEIFEWVVPGRPNEWDEL